MLLIKLSAWFLSPCGLRLCGRLQQQEEGKIDRFIEECAVDPTLRERLTVLSRIFHNKQAKVRGDSMLFSDNISRKIIGQEQLASKIDARDTINLMPNILLTSTCQCFLVTR